MLVTSNDDAAVLVTDLRSVGACVVVIGRSGPESSLAQAASRHLPWQDVVSLCDVAADNGVTVSPRQPPPGQRPRADSGGMGLVDVASQASGTSSLAATPALTREDALRFVFVGIAVDDLALLQSLLWVCGAVHQTAHTYH